MAINIDSSQLELFNQVTNGMNQAMQSYLDNLDKYLINETPVAKETQLALCEDAEKAVVIYEKAVNKGTKSLDGYTNTIGSAQKYVNSSSIQQVNGYIDAVTKVQNGAASLNTELATTKQVADSATQKAEMLQVKSEISPEVRTRLQNIVTRYNSSRSTGEQVSDAVANVITGLLNVIKDLEAQKQNLESAKQNEHRQGSTQGNNSNPNTFNNADMAEYAAENENVDTDFENINQVYNRQSANNGSQRNGRQQGGGVSQRAAAQQILNNGTAQQQGMPINYGGVQQSVESVKVDFDLTPRVVKYLTNGNSYDRYTVMMRLTACLLKNVQEHLDMYGEVLQKITWDSRGHLYFNNRFYDFKLNSIDGADREFSMMLESDLIQYVKNNEWSKVFIIGEKAMHRYCASVGVLDFATVEQYNEFVSANTKRGIFGYSAANIPKVCKMLQKRGMVSVTSIRLNGVDAAYSSEAYAEIADYDRQIAEATTQEEYSTAFNNRAQRAMNVPDTNLMNRVSGITESLRQGVNLPNMSGAKSFIARMWEKPIFRVPCKVFGYAKGVPLAFGLLSAMGPFAVLCGVFGLGVLGATELKKAKQTMGMSGNAVAAGGAQYIPSGGYENTQTQPTRQRRRNSRNSDNSENDV